MIVHASSIHSLVQHLSFTVNCTCFHLCLCCLEHLQCNISETYTVCTEGLHFSASFYMCYITAVCRGWGLGGGGPLQRFRLKSRDFGQPIQGSALSRLASIVHGCPLLQNSTSTAAYLTCSLQYLTRCC